jgi:putative ABC transport system permease protein
VTPQDQKIAVRCRGLTKNYGSGEGSVAALQGVDLNVRSGELLMLVGPSGCGKTTLISIITGYENQNQKAVLKALGATSKTLALMVLVQAAVCSSLGTGIGLSLCGIAARIVIALGFPFRMMWFTPLVGMVGVVLVSVAAAAISLRPVVKLQPAVVFADR